MVRSVIHEVAPLAPRLCMASGCVACNKQHHARIRLGNDCTGGDASSCWFDKADFLFRCLRIRYQLIQYAENQLKPVIGFVTKRLELAPKPGMIDNEMPLLDEGAHDLYIDLDGCFAGQYAGQHGHPLLGERHGWMSQSHFIPIGGRNLRPPNRQLFLGQFKHEIRRKTIDIPTNLFLQTLGLNSVKGCKIPIQHNLETANGVNSFGYLVQFNGCFHMSSNSFGLNCPSAEKADSADSCG